MTNERSTPQSTPAKIQAASAAMREFAEVLKTGPQLGLHRIGPSIAGIRLITL